MLLTLDKIIKAEGTIITDIKNRSGNRRQKYPTQSLKQGEKQIRKQATDDYGRTCEMHKDAQGVGNINLEVSRCLFKEDMQLGEIVVTATEEEERSATVMKK